MEDHDRILPLYRRYREISSRLATSLLHTLGKDVFEQGAQELGMFRRGAVVLDSEADMDILADYCVHDYRVDGRNSVERYLETTPPPAGSEEELVLKAMADAYYSVFEIKDKVRGAGATMFDLLRGETRFMADVGLGTTATIGMALAVRVFPLPDFLMSAGAAIPFQANQLPIVAREVNRLFGAGTDLSSLTKQQQGRLASFLIRLGRGANMTSRIRYAAPGERPRPAPGAPGGQLAGPGRVKIGRNDPCPCGSGKKFKKCCGVHQS
jgi:hypothetical protein